MEIFRISAIVRHCLAGAFVCCLVASPGAVYGQDAGQLLDTAIREQADTDTKSVQSQIRVAQLSDQEADSGPGRGEALHPAAA
jgi:hypothetical protein